MDPIQLLLRLLQDTPSPAQQPAQLIFGDNGITNATHDILGAVQGAAIRTGLVVFGGVLLLIVLILLVTGPAGSTRRQIVTTGSKTAFRAVAK